MIDLNYVYNYVVVDFDGTLVSHKFPEIGEPINEVIQYIRMQSVHGAKIILFTYREDTKERLYLSEAVQYCKDNKIPIDAVNENPFEKFDNCNILNDGKRRKFYFDILIDDRAVNFSEVIKYIGELE